VAEAWCPRAASSSLRFSCARQFLRKSGLKIKIAVLGLSPEDEAVSSSGSKALWDKGCLGASEDGRRVSPAALGRDELRRSRAGLGFADFMGRGARKVILAVTERESCDTMRVVKENSICLKCGESFECGFALGKSECWCQELDGRLAARIGNGESCLCPRCLKREIQESKGNRPETTKKAGRVKKMVRRVS